MLLLFNIYVTQRKYCTKVLVEALQPSHSIDARHTVGRTATDVSKVWKMTLLGCVEEILPGEATVSFSGPCGCSIMLNQKAPTVLSDLPLPVANHQW